MCKRTNTDAHPTSQHEKSAHRDHPDDRHDFFPLGLFHDFDSVHVAIQRHAGQSAKAASGRQAPAESAAITIDKDDRLFLDKQPVDKSLLRDLLRQQLVKNPELLLVINAADGVAHGRVVEVMDIARSADVVKMAIAVKPKEQRP